MPRCVQQTDAGDGAISFHQKMVQVLKNTFIIMVKTDNQTDKRDDTKAGYLSNSLKNVFCQILALVHLFKTFLADGFNSQEKNRKTGIRKHFQQFFIICNLHGDLC